MALNDVMGMNIAQVIEYYGNHSRYRNRTFFMYYDEEGEFQEISFGRFLEISMNYAKLIDSLRRHQGKEAGGRFHVGFYMQNTPEVLYAFGGCAFANATLVGINNAQIGQRLAMDIKNMDVDMLFVDEIEQPKSVRTFLESVMEANDDFDLSSLYPQYVIARKKQQKNHPDRVVTIEEMLKTGAGKDFNPTPLEQERAGVIIFTSGTTGMPKGIEVPWKKVFDVGVISTTILDYGPDDVSYVCMPLNHSNSLYLSFIPALLNGAKLLLRRRFSAGNFVKDIERVGATVWNSVGDPVRYVLNTVGEKANYAHLPLRTVISTGTNAHNRKAFTRIFGLNIFTEAFGSTEVGAIATVTPDTPSYCVGKYLPGKEIKIVDESTGHERDPAQVDSTGRILNFDKAVGEILISQESLGNSAFTGYYNMPRESADRVDDAGYYHMGDLGAYVELEGGRYIIFLGRTGTDRLRSKGENFSAAFVEEIVLDYQGVLNCVVIGIPHVDSTENDNPIYIVEVEDPPQFDVSGLYAFCRNKVPAYALPGYIRVVGELPKTDTQKVRKPVLLREFIERTPTSDANEKDLLYSVNQGTLQEFTTGEYRREMGKCTDPTVRSRFEAVTRRQDLFQEEKTMRVLICDDIFPAMMEVLHGLLSKDEVRSCRQEDVEKEAPWAEVLIPSMTRVTSRMIDSSPDLKLIQQFGVGLEGVDIPAAAAKGIPVANVPGNQAPVHAECTAEGGVFLMMACARMFKKTQETLSKGEWGRPRGEALIDRTALIIGLGAVGKALAQRLTALGMKVMATDMFPTDELARELGLLLVAEPQELDSLLPRADFVISAVTLTPDTRGSLNRSVFERMKPSAYLINISRGPIVDEEDLLAAINEGIIAGAGLDVLNSEPPSPTHPLLNHERIVITPHTAGVTEQSFGALARGVADNISRLKEGRSLRNTVTQ